MSNARCTSVVVGRQSINQSIKQSCRRRLCIVQCSICTKILAWTGQSFTANVDASSPLTRVSVLQESINRDAQSVRNALLRFVSGGVRPASAASFFDFAVDYMSDFFSFRGFTGTFRVCLCGRCREPKSVAKSGAEYKTGSCSITYDALPRTTRSACAPLL
jgi:hypothetical protein